MTSSHYQLTTQLRTEFDNEKNNVRLEHLSLSSKTYVYWICPSFGHSYQARIDHRTKNYGNGSGCPYCAGKKVLVGFNDFSTYHPEAALYWNAALNSDSPQDFTPKSDKIRHWSCSNCGNTWKTAIKHMAEKDPRRLCSRCSTRTTVTASSKRELYVKEWDHARNQISFDDAAKSPDVDRYWLCSEKQHSYMNSIQNRRRWNGECKVCSNREVLVGYNDLATTHPEIAAQWHPTKNKEITPQEVTAYAARRVHWKCDKGHEWETGLKDRVSKGYTCGECAAAVNPRSTSKSEEIIWTYLLKSGEQIQRRVRGLLNNPQLELDLYFPQRQLAIEYNGTYWHSIEKKQKRYHRDKYDEAKLRGIMLIHLWEHEPHTVSRDLDNILLLVKGEKITPSKEKLIIRIGSVEEYLYDLSNYMLVKETQTNKMVAGKFVLYGAGTRTYRHK